MSRKRLSVRVGVFFAACLAAFGLFSLNAWPPGQWAAEAQNPLWLAQAARPVVPPQVLYQRAWRIIKEQFFDQKFNGQDWHRWEHRYDGKLKTTDDAHKAVETMLASLGDPYTRFLNRDAFDEEKSQIEARLFGVGMQLGMNKDHRVVVIAPIEGTPAYAAGLHPGDEIFEVEGKPVKGQSLDQVVKQIRGPINTKVTLTVMRGTERKRFTLTRAEIPIRAVANQLLLPGNIGYIRLDSFISSKANDEMRNALKKMHAANGLILDLRNNPGGLLTNAIEIANMFLDHGVIVSTIDADGYKTSQVSARHPMTQLPVVVLINGASASASEILSGALRDNGRAKLVGQKSFGKGLVQAINKLDDGSGINVTIARYLTPNDTDIHKHGITPDFEIALKEEDLKAGKGPWWIDPTFTKFNRQPTDGKDVQLAKAIEVLKKEMIATSSSTTASAPSALRD